MRHLNQSLNTRHELQEHHGTRTNGRADQAVLTAQDVERTQQ